MTAIVGEVNCTSSCRNDDSSTDFANVILRGESLSTFFLGTESLSTWAKNFAWQFNWPGLNTAQPRGFRATGCATCRRAPNQRHMCNVPHARNISWGTPKYQTEAFFAQKKTKLRLLIIHSAAKSRMRESKHGVCAIYISTK